MARSPACRFDDPCALLDTQTHEAMPERDRGLGSQRAFPMRDGAGDDLGHHNIALEPRQHIGIGTAEAHIGNQVGEHRLMDSGLAQ